MDRRYYNNRIPIYSDDDEILRQRMLAEKGMINQNPQVSPYSQTRPTLGQTLGKALLLGTQAFSTGRVPSEAFETAKAAEPDWYTKQLVEQQNAREMEKYKQELKPRGVKYANVGGNYVAIDQDTGDIQTLFEKQKSSTDKLAEMKLQEKEDTKLQAKEAVVSSANEMLNIIKQVKAGKDYFGPYGKLPTSVTSLGGMVDYNKRKTWENYTDQLLAKKGFDMMTELRNASRTGATGLGQLTEKEGTWLKQASTALSRDISKEEAEKILTEMERLYQKVVDGSGTTGAGSSNTPATVTDYKSKYGLD